jgi:hypothetical protein
MGVLAVTEQASEVYDLAVRNTLVCDGSRAGSPAQRRRPRWTDRFDLGHAPARQTRDRPGRGLAYAGDDRYPPRFF